MKRILLTITGFIAALLLFTGGAYAANQGWLNFTGDDEIEQSQNNVDEIMKILRNVNDGKITAEDAIVKLEARVQELEDMNPSGLAKQNKELRERVAQLEDDIAAKNQAYDQLQNERDQIAAARDNAIAERDTLQAEYNNLNDSYTSVQDELEQANEYVTHLESELTRANEAVANHAQNTNAAVEEARTYQGDK